MIPSGIDGNKPCLWTAAITSMSLCPAGSIKIQHEDQITQDLHQLLNTVVNQELPGFISSVLGLFLFNFIHA